MGRTRKALRRRLVIGAAVVVAAAVGFGLYWFQPWKLWQDDTVEEALPGVAKTSAPLRRCLPVPSPLPPSRRPWRVAS